jgi:UDP-glucose 4-epimerase
LVTGGAGYIGSHCCKALSEAGLVPVCLDNCSTGHPRFVKWGPAVKDDVRNTEAVLQAFRQHNVVAVMHFAASSAVGESVVNPEKYYTNNVLCEPVNPYGSSKLIERILSDYRSAYQMRSICFRYFNASGADSAGHIGELRDPETHLIPRVMMRLQRHVSEFAVFGIDPRRHGSREKTRIAVAEFQSFHGLNCFLSPGRRPPRCRRTLS